MSRNSVSGNADRGRQFNKICQERSFRACVNFGCTDKIKYNWKKVQEVLLSSLSRQFMGKVFFLILVISFYPASLASYNCSIGNLRPCDASTNSLSIFDRIPASIHHIRLLLCVYIPSSPDIFLCCLRSINKSPKHWFFHASYIQ
jgi:hypothetical protein